VSGATWTTSAVPIPLSGRPANPHASEEQWWPIRFVVGVDGSGRSLRALIWAAHEAALWRCSLRIVHVLPLGIRHSAICSGTVGGSA
jgi:Universal stress protein family